MMSLGIDQPAISEPEPGSRRAVANLLAPMAALILLLVVFAVWFVTTEQTLYHADQVTYWSYSRHLALLMREHPTAAVRAVVNTVANNDVNLLPAVPISLVMVVFGGSRLVYVIAVIVIYGFATAAALVFALSRIRPRPPPWVAPLTLALVATVWQPVFIGYLGIGGVALALVVIGLAWSSGSSPPSTRTLVHAGILLAMLALFRRWWGIWSLAFGVVMVADSLWRFLVSPHRDRGSIWQAIRCPTIVLISSGVTVVVLAAPVIVSRLQTDYADRYSAYRLSGVSERLVSIVDRFGLVGLAVLAVCTSVLFATPKLRRIAALLVAHLACTFFIMISIQDHSPQHWYLYSPQVLLITGAALVQIASDANRARRRTILLGLAAAGLATVFAVFAPSGGDSRGRLAPLLPADVIRPQVRHDLEELKRLLSSLDTISSGREGGVYVLSSSQKLSDHVLAFSNLSLGTSFRSPNEVLGAAHVDRRDGFPRGLLVADVVLVADPVQYHLRAEDQRTIGEPATSFLDGTDIALAFSRLPDRFELDGGVMVTIYQRQRPNTREEVAALSERLRRAYPDQPEIYSPENE